MRRATLLCALVMSLLCMSSFAVSQERAYDGFSSAYFTDVVYAAVDLGPSAANITVSTHDVIFASYTLETLENTFGAELATMQPRCTIAAAGYRVFTEPIVNI